MSCVGVITPRRGKLSRVSSETTETMAVNMGSELSSTGWCRRLAIQTGRFDGVALWATVGEVC
jgi:hypothetical protein